MVVWECLICHKGYVAKTSVARHQREDHGIAQGQYEVRKHSHNADAPQQPSRRARARKSMTTLASAEAATTTTTTTIPGPLRSSRSTRNHDHQVNSRNRPGVVDLDPTEGLPVQKWEQITIRVNQDPSSDPTASTTLPSGTTTTSSAEWSAQFGTPQFPWPEKHLPSFFNQLPPWNQEMLRRARTGNTNAKLSVWDRKTSSWISAAEAEKRQNPLKSVHLNNLEPKQDAAPDSPAHEDEDDHDEKSDEELDGDNADDDVGPTATSGLKRRKKYAPEERILEVKRWVQMPSAVADKVEERKFLADRRPGMPSLYGGAYQNQVFGSMGLNANGYGFSAANAGYDLGDGGGLGNAGGVLQSNEGASTPVRKNMPPKRKKKKGGPGRKKANPNPVPQTDANGAQSTMNGGQTLDGTNETKQSEDVTMTEGDHDGSDSGSEGEGSEEGEIDEGGHENEKQNDQAERQTQAPESLEQPQPFPVAVQPNDPMATDIDLASTTEPEISKASTNITEPEIQPADEAVDIATRDEAVSQQESAPVLEQVVQPEPEVIPSITQPPVSEQLPELPPPEAAPLRQPELIAEQLPIHPLPTVEPQPQLPPTEPEPEPEPSSELEPMAPSVMPAELPSLTVPGLEPVPVQPTTQLPPISTVVAEAMDQPSISAPGAEPPSAPPAVQVPVPEPTSPDLLGGLEDELNKNMGEQNGE